MPRDLAGGPPGLGKTTFATCIPRDLGVGLSEGMSPSSPHAASTVPSDLPQAGRSWYVQATLRL